MSNFRALLILAAGILAALVLLLTGGPSEEAIQVSGREILDGLSASEAIVLERGTLPRVRLTRDERWELCEPYAAPADEQQVMKLLDAFAQAPILDYMSEEDLSRRGRTLSDFALESPSVVVRFVRAHRDETVSLGVPTPAGDGVYARIGGIAGVFVIGNAVTAAVDLSVDNLRRRTLFRIGSESVSAFDIRRGQGNRMSFVRGADGWHLGSERASEANVRKFLDTLTAAEAIDFIWPVGASNETTEVSSALLAGYGLDPESAWTVTLKGTDGLDRSLSLGKSVDDHRVYAFAQNGSSVVTVSAELKAAAGQDVRLFTDSRLFPMEAPSVAYFTVVDGETTYAFARSEKNAWRLESPVTAPADSERVEQLLGKILTLSPKDADPKGLAVSLSTNSTALAVVRSRLMGLGGFDDLRSKEVLRLDAAHVHRLVRTPGGEKATPVAVVYARDRQAWNLEQATGDGRVSVSGIDTVLKALSPLMAERIERLKVSSTDLDDYGLNVPYLTLAIDSEGTGSVRRNLIIGGRTEGGRFATIGSADAVFVLRDSVVAALETPLTE